MSYNWKDETEVLAVTKALERRELKVFLDRSCLRPGIPWPDELEKSLDASRALAVFVGPHGLGPWQNREKGLGLERQNHEPDFPVIPILLPDSDPPLGFLKLNTWIDLRDGVSDPTKLDALVRAARGEAPGPTPGELVASSICPYRGLLAFREEDASYFFGRDAFITRLEEAVARHSLVAVVGPSGSGKSSVVRAGLVPKLRRAGWEIATFVVGDRPFRNLAAALMPLLEPEMSETDRFKEIKALATQMHGDTTNIRDVAERVLEKLPGTKRLLLVADQWEELYTLTQDRDERAWFLRQTIEATSGIGAPLTVVITLRGEFYGRALEDRSLADRLHDGSVPIGPMNDQEFLEVIVKPAERAGLEFQAGLPQRILNAIGKEPGSLPLLEFLLTRLWEERSGRELVHESYDRMGGLQGALGMRAEEIFESLDVGKQEVARRVFLGLVRTEQELTTRRRASFAELGRDAVPVIRELAKARLLVTGWESDTGLETVELAHETLIRNWARFEEWIRRDREFLLWRERLRSARKQFQRFGEKPGALLQGLPLAESLNKLAERRSELSEEERSFIRKSERVARARSTLARLYRALVVLFVGGGGIAAAGFLAEKSYAVVTHVDRGLTFARAVETGLSFLSTLLVSSLSLLLPAVLVLIGGLAVYRSWGAWFAERLSKKEATSWRERPGLLVAAQSATFLLLFAVVLLLLDAVPFAFGTLPQGEDLARRKHLYDRLSFVPFAAVLTLSLLARWRRSLSQISHESRSLSEGLTFLLSIAIHVVLVVDLCVFAVGYGVLVLPHLGV